mmetsp:Transcript_22221/g.48394  ORF Transcript_22221/g.48394 Transcript_22221/m.48394 type:complete len:117 (-) Transcript_22221:17-367(-)
MLGLRRNSISNAGAEAFAEVLRYDNRTLRTLYLYENPDISHALMEKIARLAQINSESVECSAVEVGRKKRAEYGPTLDMIYAFVRSKPYLLSAAGAIGYRTTSPHFNSQVSVVVIF